MTGYTILSLDLGSTIGWALIVDEVITESGVANFFRKETHPGDRFLRFNNWLQNHKNINEVFYEHVPRFESAASARVYCGFLAILQVFCQVNRKRMTNISPKSVKKEFTGNGNSDKAAMCRTAHRLGWKHGHPDTEIDHDEADAIALSYVILKRRGIEPRLYA